MRIVRRVETWFPSGESKMGSGFFIREGHVLTCAHVVMDDSRIRAKRVRITNHLGTEHEGAIVKVVENLDLALLSDPSERGKAPRIGDDSPRLGEHVVFAGQPAGVARLSIFPGTISAVGPGLLKGSVPDWIQIAGMVNSGNSGGPLVRADGSEVVGVIAAKNVPLLREIDALIADTEKIPQFPREVALGRIDVSGFVNTTIQVIHQLASVLRLVQVGTGWAVPIRHARSSGLLE